MPKAHSFVPTAFTVPVLAMIYIRHQTISRRSRLLVGASHGWAVNAAVAKPSAQKSHSARVCRCHKTWLPTYAISRPPCGEVVSHCCAETNGAHLRTPRCVHIKSGDPR